MASLVPHEGSSVQTVLVGKGEGRSHSHYGDECAAAVPGRSAPVFLGLQLTQEQVEDPRSQLAGAERGHQAAEVRRPVGLPLQGYGPAGLRRVSWG